MDTRLVDAARRGDALAVRSLLFHGGTIHAKDEIGRTPLMIAALNGHEETVLELLDSAEAHLDPAMIDEQESQGGYTSLHFASGAGQVKIVRLLISVGATVNSTNSYGWTPLHIASWNDRPDTARELLLRGARLDAIDALGRTPLHLASQRGRLRVAFILLDAGADLATLDHDGHSPLDVAKDKETAAAICKRATSQVPTTMPIVVPPIVTPTPPPPPVTTIPATVSVPVITPSSVATADAASLNSNNDTNATANWNLVHTLMDQSKETKKTISLLTELVEKQQGQHSSSLLLKDDTKITTMSSSSCTSPEEVENIKALQATLARCKERDAQQNDQLTQLRSRVLEMEKQERQRVVQIAAMLGKIALYKSQQTEMTKTLAVLFPPTWTPTNNNKQQQQQQTTTTTCSSLHRQQSC